MTPEAQAAPLGSSVGTAAATQPLAPTLLWRTLAAPWKLFLGMVFCQSLAGSIFVVGWTYRLAQRSALKYWFSRSARPHGPTEFTQFLRAERSTRAHVHWPNWFLEQNFRQAARPQPEQGVLSGAFATARALVHSLALNFWIGLRGIANTWALTLPAGVLWWFGWYDGWNNSFNKGYEQAAAGPLISLIGIAWFIAAMFYLPLAQARQAVTGEWRSFYQFRLIRKIAKDRWFDCLLLAAGYCLLSIPLSILKTSPMFWMHSSPTLSALSNGQVIAMLKSYFFWCALVMLPAYVILRLVAVRVYASGLLSLVQSGQLGAAELAAEERDVLNRLGLLSVPAQQQRHPFARCLAWAGARVAGVAGTGILVLSWFSFVAQIYLTQFLNYHSGLGWINQPLVQLPWFRYLPTAVKNPLGDGFSVLLVWLAAVLVRSIARHFATRRRR